MRQKANHKMIDLNLYISVITIKINGLNTPVKGRDYQIR